VLEEVKQKNYAFELESRMFTDRVKEFKVNYIKNECRLLMNPYKLYQLIQYYIGWDVFILVEHINEVIVVELSSIWFLMVLFQSENQGLIDDECVVIPGFAKMLE